MLLTYFYLLRTFIKTFSVNESNRIFLKVLKTNLKYNDFKIKRNLGLDCKHNYCPAENF